nr:EAL domain-containing protein [Paenibacillus sp. NEAU-GSW1]
MGHLWALSHLSDSTDQWEKEDSGMGIIYLSWHRSESAAANGIKKKGAFHSEWRRYIERVTNLEQASGDQASYVWKYWMNDDLFLVVKLPTVQQRTTMELRLMELAGKRQHEWEQHFLEQTITGRETGMRLHAGVSLLEGCWKNSRSDLFYEATKRAMLHGQSEGAMIRSMKLRALEELIEQRSVDPVYQPIISLQGEERIIFGYEALTRCRTNKWFDGPLQLFTFAEQEGMVYALDRLARERSIDGCDGMQQTQKLFINVPAHIMDDPSFSPGQTMSLLNKRKLSPHNVVFEITERSSIEDFGAAKKVLEHYRKQGYQIAIDDVGAGYSSLQSIIELRPDYIKVDRSIIDRIDEDEVKAHILHTLVQLALKLNIAIIAEGIEREEELAAVKEIGVHFAQGYLLGRPGKMAGNMV